MCIDDTYRIIKTSWYTALGMFKVSLPFHQPILLFTSLANSSHLKKNIVLLGAVEKVIFGIKKEIHIVLCQTPPQKKK